MILPWFFSLRIASGAKVIIRSLITNPNNKVKLNSIVHPNAVRAIDQLENQYAKPIPKNTVGKPMEDSKHIQRIEIGALSSTDVFCL